MLKKHPSQDRLEDWEPVSLEQRELEAIDASSLGKLIDRQDPNTGVGPRGLKGHHLFSALRGLDGDAAVGALATLAELGTLLVYGKCPWASRVLSANLLTPLNKDGDRMDARPTSAKDIDYSIFLKALQRSFTPTVRDYCHPFQLAVGTKGGCEVVNWGFKLITESKLLGADQGSLL
jgi:hypothetical protein